MTPRLSRYLPPRFGLLIRVLLVVGPKVAARLFRVWSVKSEGIEFVVAHDRQSRPRVDHGPDDLQRLPYLGAAVDEVAKEDGLAFGMPVDAVVLGIAEFGQELLQGVSVAVDVADEVVHG